LPAKYYSGNSGDVVWGSTALLVKSWKATEEVELLSVINKGSNGFNEVIYGNRKLSGSVEADWNAEINPGNPPLVHAGVETTDVAGVALKLYIQEGGQFFNIPFAAVGKVEISSAVDGMVSYSFDFESNGSYSLPGEGA
jgi:hypothetical protein